VHRAGGHGDRSPDIVIPLVDLSLWRYVNYFVLLGDPIEVKAFHTLIFEYPFAMLEELYTVTTHLEKLTRAIQMPTSLPTERLCSQFRNMYVDPGSDDGSTFPDPMTIFVMMRSS